MRKLFLTIFLALLSASVVAQPFPSRAVRIVVPFPPGGSADVLGRLMAQKLTELWAQPVVIENKPGASANIGADHVAKSLPDGYTLLLATPAFGVSAAAFSNLTYEAQRDFTPVAMLSVFPNVLIVHPSVPATTPQEFIRYAKDNPAKLSYASAGSTSAIRFAFEHLKQITGIEAVHIPYKGSAPSTQAMLSGESQTMMMTLVDALPHIKSGRLRALAATTPRRIAALPELPTLSETVAPGFDYVTWHGFFAPAGTPAAVVEKINRDVNAILGQADVKERLTSMGMETRSGPPAELGTLLREEIKKWQDVARVANIKAE